jgi:peptidoglycan/LPS O-acetylase OafA/YrhL
MELGGVRMLKTGRVIVFFISGFMLLIGGLFLVMSLLRQDPSPSGGEADVLLWLEALGMPALAMVGAFWSYHAAKVGALVVLVAGAGIAVLAVFGGFEVKYMNAAFGIIISAVAVMMVFAKQHKPV